MGEGSRRRGLENVRAVSGQRIPFLKAKNKGRMVFVYEDAGLDQLVATPSYADGTREKTAAANRALAQKVKRDNVTVNALFDRRDRRLFT